MTAVTEQLSDDFRAHIRVSSEVYAAAFAQAHTTAKAALHAEWGENASELDIANGADRCATYVAGRSLNFTPYAPQLRWQDRVSRLAADAGEELGEAVADWIRGHPAVTEH